jgi:uncharacterized protein
MKKIAIILINIYQKIIANALFSLGLKGDCRFSPTCSEYTKTQIKNKGIVRGGALALVRISKCQPFYKGK